MKINKIIISSDKNPNYFDFWKPLSKVWKNFGFEPILFLISDQDTEIYEDEFGLVKEIKAVEGIDTGFQSQIVRLYAHKFLQDDICLISDIDMFPLQKTYFINSVNHYDDNKIIIFSADAYGGNHRYPMCYVASKGNSMTKCLGIENKTWEEFVKELHGLNMRWDTDEIYMSIKINEYESLCPDDIIRLNRGWFLGRALHRIDRVQWSYDMNLLKNGGYIDTHSLRPYNQYKDAISIVLNNINFEK